MTQLTDSVYAVEVQENSKWHQIVHISPGIQVLQYYLLDGYLENKSTGIDLPPGNWRLLCTNRSCTPEQAKEITGEEVYPSIALAGLLKGKGLDSEKNYCLIKKL